MKSPLLLSWLLFVLSSQAADPIRSGTNPPSGTNLVSPSPNPHDGGTSVIALLKNFCTFAVTPLAGLWVVYHYVRGRTYEKMLLLDIKTSSNVLGEKRVLFVEVQLTNHGKGKLQARPVGPEDYVYTDKDEQLKYSCGLQVKRVALKKLAGDTYMDWYKCPALEPVPDIPAEMNLLGDYVVPAENDKIEFWLEPGDIANLAAPLVLQPGHHLLKVSFYGITSEDYWSRETYVRLE
jgi:hypothetical protein